MPTPACPQPLRQLDRIDMRRSGEDRQVEPPPRHRPPPSRKKPGARITHAALRLNLRVLSYSLSAGNLSSTTPSPSAWSPAAPKSASRAIGDARATVLALFLAETMLFDLIDATLGVVLGRILAAGAVNLIASTVNALYATSRPTAVELTAAEAAGGILTEAFVALLSAFAPAREAMQVAPTEAMSRGAREHHARLRWRRGLAWSALLAVLALAASQLDPISGYPIGGYAAALLSIGAAAMAAPALVIAVNRATRGLVRGRVSGLLAGRSLTASLSRTSVVVAALATAIAMMASRHHGGQLPRNRSALARHNSADFYIAANAR